MDYCKELCMLDLDSLFEQVKISYTGTIVEIGESKVSQEKV